MFQVLVPREDDMGVDERHRHRYEVNPEIVPDVEKIGGVRFVGKDDTNTRMEILEIPDHPYFVAFVLFRVFFNCWVFIRFSRSLFTFTNAFSWPSA
jgi:hypothetical protein